MTKKNIINNWLKATEELRTEFIEPRSDDQYTSNYFDYINGRIINSLIFSIMTADNSVNGQAWISPKNGMSYPKLAEKRETLRENAKLIQSGNLSDAIESVDYDIELHQSAEMKLSQMADGLKALYKKYVGKEHIFVGDVKQYDTYLQNRVKEKILSNEGSKILGKVGLTKKDLKAEVDQLLTEVEEEHRDMNF